MTKFTELIAGIVVLYALCFIIDSAQSTPIKATPSQAKPKNPADIIRRIAGNGKRTSKRAVSQEKLVVSGDSNKFQPQMMRVDPHRSATQEQSTYFDSSDSWQAHSLLPTFTDQEQGDEMVALASDSEPEHAKSGSSGRSQAPQEARESQLSGGEEKSRDNRENQRPNSKQLDEYYGDDEDDEEDQEINTKQKQHSDNQRGEFTNNFSEDNSKKEVEAPLTNHSALKISSPALESGWQPAGGLNYVSQVKQQLDSSNQQSKHPFYKDGHVQSGSEKLLDLLGGGAFSKADVAIEYLRNILKSKQLSQQNNFTSEANNLKNQSNQAKIASLDKLSSIATRFNRTFNETSTLDSRVNETVKQFDSATKTKDMKKTQGGQLPTIDQLNKSFLAQQAEAKFSINDAKSTSNYDLFTHQSSIYPSVTSTTKLPNEDQSTRQGPQQSLYSKSQSNIKTQAQLQDPNGTPLGGDYIESLDDFPRASQQQQHLFASQQQQSHQQIRQHDNRQQDPFLTQAAQINERPAIDFPQSRQQQASQLIDPAQFNQGSYDVFHQHLIGVPNSSMFFQMQQATADPKVQPPAKQEEIKEPKKSLKNPDIYKEQANSQIINYDIATASQKVTILPQIQPQTSVNKTDQTSLLKYDKVDELKRPVAVNQPKQSIQQQPIDSNNQQQYQTAQQAPISSKIYNNEPKISPQAPDAYHMSKQNLPEYVEHHSRQNPKVKPPKIVSYNYFESPSETGESELLTTNYQLGDALYSSNGGVEQVLSSSELEAIQSQFLTAEHPVVPISNNRNYQQPQHPSPYQDQNLAGLLANLKPSSFHPDELQKLGSSAKQVEETMKELASNEDQVSVAAPSRFNEPQGLPTREQARPQESHLDLDAKNIFSKPSDSDSKKKKSLIVYLNHPRPVDMSKISTGGENYSLSQSIGEPSIDPFISAKEFDSHGLSKDTKHLDISNLRGLGDIKEGQDKDGLSVVVIGDAYKYKKIVLLISSKSGGLKFIPMVKDMKKK